MTETTVDRKLFEIFDEAFDLYNSFETCAEPTNSLECQIRVKKCIKLFEDCTRLVSICGLFSSNESYTELPTSNLKYLLLPFFLGKLNQKICGGSRADIVEVAEVYFKDFLKRASDYGLHTVQPTPSAEPSNSSDPLDSLTRTVLSRNQKLEKYRQQKELEDEINKLKIVMKEQKMDDETEREFYIKLLKMSVIDAQDELASIEQEKQILAYQKVRGEMNAEEKKLEDKKVVATNPLKPVIITKDLAQKAVYGLGYPSLPTMTVQEFYDDRVREKFFPDPKLKTQQKSSVPIDENEERIEDIEREEKLENDDEYERARLKAKDEFKDDHRRGEGNRYNRS